VGPIPGRTAVRAADAGGLKPFPVPCLLIEGRNRAGVIDDISEAMGEAGINGSFLVALAIGARFRAIYGFAEATDLARAVRVIRAATR
jgi:hypothetical protein